MWEVYLLPSAQYCSSQCLVYMCARHIYIWHLKYELMCVRAMCTLKMNWCPSKCTPCNWSHTCVWSCVTHNAYMLQCEMCMQLYRVPLRSQCIVWKQWAAPAGLCLVCCAGWPPPLWLQTLPNLYIQGGGGEERREEKGRERKRKRQKEEEEKGERDSEGGRPTEYVCRSWLVWD